ncbi:MAG: hypothetical protein JO249_04615 [Acidobacteria bacterium]|nr:hypothetical protein [Acidobacteriota bacterium]
MASTISPGRVPSLHALRRDRRNREYRNNLDIDTQVVGMADNRNQDSRKQGSHRLGSHSKCSVAVEAY